MGIALLLVLAGLLILATLGDGLGRPSSASSRLVQDVGVAAQALHGLVGSHLTGTAWPRPFGQASGAAPHPWPSRCNGRSRWRPSSSRGARHFANPRCGRAAGEPGARDWPVLSRWRLCRGGGLGGEFGGVGGGWDVVGGGVLREVAGDLVAGGELGERGFDGLADVLRLPAP